MAQHKRRSVLQGGSHCETGILGLSDDLVTKILAHLNLNELARMHMVGQRFNRLLSRPDPSLRPYGSTTLQVDMDRKGELPPSMIDSYLLRRAAGFTRVCFQSHSAVDEGLQPWNRRFFRIKLPQIAAALAKYHVQLEIEVFEGGGHMFFSIPEFTEADHILESQLFSDEYWEVLSPVLTKLNLSIVGDEVMIEGINWLNLMRNLQHLEIRGVDVKNRDWLRPALFPPGAFSLPALKLLRLENLESMTDCQLNCPSLEALHIREIEEYIIPTGLGECSRLTTLDVAARMSMFHPNKGMGADLLEAIESVEATLEILDISGWAPALSEVLQVISRLPRLHTLIAQRNGLTIVPALPATLKSLDLRANLFTEVPMHLESLTQLTYLAMSSEEGCVNFQIRRPLDAIISLPHLRELTFVLDQPNVYGPGFTEWGARSLYYLGLAQHEIARSNRTLKLKF